MASKYNYNGKIQKAQRPSKRTLKLQGKTVFDKSSSREGQTVWKKKIIKRNGYHENIIMYVMAKCDKEGCEGHLVYDKRNYKICNICGLGNKDNYNNNVFLGIVSTKNTYAYNKDDSIKRKNIRYDTLEINADDFMYHKDKGFNNIKVRLNRIIEWERKNRGESNGRATNASV